MNRLATISATSLITMFALTALSGLVVAGSCTATATGFFQQNAECWFGCSSGQRVGVIASVDDNGEVDALVECADADAGCSDQDGFCTDTSTETTTYSDQTGHCSGGGNGGFWTSFQIDCWSETGGSAPSSEPSPGPLLVLPPGASSWARIVGTPAGINGFVCNETDCFSVPVTCVINSVRWECWI